MEARAISEVVPLKIGKTTHIGRTARGLSEGRFFVFHTRTKTSNSTGRDQFIVHQLPQELSTIVHTYLSIVKPMSITLSKVLYGIQAARTHKFFLFSFKGKQMTPDDFRMDFRHFCLTYFKWADAGVQVYRHANIAMARVFIPPEISDIDVGHGVANAQAGHSDSVARHHYSVLSGGHEFVSQDRMIAFSRYSMA